MSLNQMKRKNYRIGILGGTFDPIHKGHIEPAQEALSKFELDKILVIPAHIPPHKNTTKASPEHRVNMAELVCNNIQGFELDTREIKRPSLSYTIETINEIKSEYPNYELFFIMGMDSLLNFTRWHLWQEILSNCHLIINTRPGYDLSVINSDTKNLLAQHQYAHSSYNTLGKKHLNKHAGFIFLHNTEKVDISSTQIREKLAKNVECSQWLTNDIIQYININQLYKNI